MYSELKTQIKTLYFASGFIWAVPFLPPLPSNLLSKSHVRTMDKNCVSYKYFVHYFIDFHCLSANVGSYQAFMSQRTSNATFPIVRLDEFNVLKFLQWNNPKCEVVMPKSCICILTYIGSREWKHIKRETSIFKELYKVLKNGQYNMESSRTVFQKTILLVQPKLFHGSSLSTTDTH